MIRFVIKRILLLIPILLFVSFLVFSILYFVPGDPARVILGDQATPEDIAELNAKLGYDRPFVERYFRYIGDAFLRLDLGKSYRTGQPVIIDVLSRFPVSLKLAITSIIVSVAIGLPLGVLSAIKQYSLFDTISRVISIFIASVPIFWLGMLSIFVFSLHFGCVPSNGVENWEGYILPTLSLALPYAGTMLRFTRSSMLETIRQDYVRTARAKGIPYKKVIFDHAFVNALLPVIAVIGESFGALLGGAVITESVFSLPGMGTMLVNGIRTKDVPVVMGATLFFATIFITLMLVVDLAYAAVDPRIKAKYKK